MPLFQSTFRTVTRVSVAVVAMMDRPPHVEGGEDPTQTRRAAPGAVSTSIASA